MKTVPSLYCPLFFEGSFGLEEGSIQAPQHFIGIIGVEQQLACTIRTCRIAGITSLLVVLPVIQQYNTLLGADSRRTTFGHLAVKVSVARTGNLQ